MPDQATISVLWQPEIGAPWELSDRCDGSDATEARIVDDVLADAPDGAGAWIERRVDGWRLHLEDPPEA